MALELASTLRTMGGSMPSGRRPRMRETESRTSAAAVSWLRLRWNSITTEERSLRLDERT